MSIGLPNTLLVGTPDEFPVNPVGLDSVRGSVPSGSMPPGELGGEDTMHGCAVAPLWPPPPACSAVLGAFAGLLSWRPSCVELPPFRNEE